MIDFLIFPVILLLLFINWNLSDIKEELKKRKS